MLGSIAAALTVCLSTAQAATFTVNTSAGADDNVCATGSGGCTLHDAISAANSAAGADTINFAPEVNPLVDLTDPLPVITSEVNIVGPGAAQLNVRRSNIAAPFSVFRAAASVSISGLTISNGLSDAGGGILATGLGDVQLTLDGVVVTGNSAVATAGDSQFAQAFGGGIAVGGQLTLRNSVVSDNSATATATGTGDASAGGGGISSRGGSIENTTVTGNGATASSATGPIAVGGGIYVTSNGVLEITRSTIGSNSSPNTAYRGGGIENNGGLTVTDSVFPGNTAYDSGGAIQNSGSLDVTNSSFDQNYASQYGGAIDNFAPGAGAANVNLNSVTLTRNKADIDLSGGGEGGATQNGDAEGTFRVTNTLYALNTAGTINDQCSGFAYSSGGFNLRQADAAPSVCVGFTAPGDFETANALVAALASNGGPTQTVALMPGSPAINAGGNCPATDQRGLYRGGTAGRCDIGAFELGATVLPPAAPAAALPAVAHKKCKKKKRKKRAAVAKKKKCKKKRKK